MTLIKHQNLQTSDLYVDAIYEGGSQKNIGADPISKILPVGNSGGFRPVKINADKKLPNHIVLYSEGYHLDWPDYLDQTTGIYRYYGDNRLPGPINGKSGNKVLEKVFDLLSKNKRNEIPPFFLFVKNPVNTERDVRFLGIAVPGGRNISSTKGLISIWRESSGGRFQNYESLFTVLDINTVSRKWIDDISKGNILNSNHCPEVWKKWVIDGVYSPLVVPPQKSIRTKQNQLPSITDKTGWEMLKIIHSHFPSKTDAIRFEKLAADLYQSSDSNVISIDVTRPSRDGGRDAIGKYRVGSTENNLIFDFNLEAKCFDPGKTAVGVKATSRLISRIRHRMFGVLVTTSYLDSQAYQEIVEDEHPIMIITGIDIIEILKNMGLNNITLLKLWLSKY
jgi:hypothetical protein